MTPRELSLESRSLFYWSCIPRHGFENDLHRLFEDSGMTQAELAAKIGVSEAYVSRVLSGSRSNFTLETMVKFALALNATVQVHLTREGEHVRILDLEEARAWEDKHHPDPEAEYLALEEARRARRELRTAKKG